MPSPAQRRASAALNPAPAPTITARSRSAIIALPHAVGLGAAGYRAEPRMRRQP